MHERIKKSTIVGIATIGAILAVISPTYKVWILVVTGLLTILAILLWPEEKEVEEYYYELPFVERLREILDRPRKQMRERSKELGLKTRKVKELEWPWERFFD